MKTIITHQENGIRSVWDEEEGLWFLVLEDVVHYLYEPINPGEFWKVLKTNVFKEKGYDFKILTKQFEIDGKQFETAPALLTNLFLHDMPRHNKKEFEEWLKELGEEDKKKFKNLKKVDFAKMMESALKVPLPKKDKK